MSRIWKVLVVMNLVQNGVCLLYVYAISHPNPYGAHYYETEQMKLELRQLRGDLAGLKAAAASEEK